MPKLTLGAGEPTADRRQHPTVLAGRHICDKRRPARLGRRVIKVELSRATPGARERNEEEKGQKTEDRSLQRRCSPCKQNLRRAPLGCATMPPCPGQIKPKRRSVAARPGPYPRRSITRGPPAVPAFAASREAAIDLADFVRHQIGA